LNDPYRFQKLACRSGPLPGINLTDVKNLSVVQKAVLSKKTFQIPVRQTGLLPRPLDDLSFVRCIAVCISLIVDVIYINDK
jgi:hypothetical protein